MNSKITGMIVLGVVGLSLGGVMLLLSSTAGKNGGGDSSSSQSAINSIAEDESVIILEKESDQIESVKVENTVGGFTLSQPASGKSTWTIEELPGINQNTTQKNGMITILGQLEAKKLVEGGVSDWEKYGLAEPLASVTVNYSDGTSEIMDIGSEAPEARYSYVRLRSANNVYMMLGSKLSYFTQRAEDYADLTLISKPADSNDWPDYGKETITRKDWDYEVVFENDPDENSGMLSSQVITSPIFAYLNITGSSDITHGMWGLVASGCELIKPTEEQLEEYGINDPFCTVRMAGDGYDYYLRVGNGVYSETEDGEQGDLIGYYCTLEGQSGQDCIYTIAASNLPWTTFKIEDVITGLMTSNYLVDLKSVTVETQTDKYFYDISTNGGSDSTLEDGKAADVTGVKANGEEVDIYNFKTFYQYIMSCPTNELCFDDPQGDWEVRITQTRKDGGEDVLELYKDTSRRYIVKLNGVTSYRIQSTWIDTLLKNVDYLFDGKEIDENY